MFLYKKTDSQNNPINWSAYINGLNGSIVIYNPNHVKYYIHNPELAMRRRSPCSTFKIISSLIALDKGIVNPENSTMIWSGENYWLSTWNKNLNISEAFHVSAVWYFRKLINKIGSTTIQTELNRLHYGNADISDWNGKQNTNDNNPDLTGFWIESSLKISPKEQVDVLENIFDKKSLYSETTQQTLKDMMFIQNLKGINIYGKTGLGKDYDIAVDAWFIGFAEKQNKKVYFSVYLGKTPNEDISSLKEKEIAIKIISEQWDKF